MPKIPKALTRPLKFFSGYPSYPKCYLNKNPHHQSRNPPYHRTPPEVNPSDKIKEPHFQVKLLIKYSIIHCKNIHHHSYIHPYFQSISMTVIYNHHRIGCFIMWNQNRITVTLNGVCSQNTNPRTLPLKRDPGPHQYHAVVVKYQ